MAKLDIFTQFRGIDRFLATLDNPLHRQIISNYRRHALLEITGQKERIFTADMTVEHPVYWIHASGMDVTLDGYDQVLTFYSALEAQEATVMIVQDEKLAVADWGFASEGLFNSFMPGPLVSTRFGEADPDKLYIVRQRLAVIWPYDDRGRMIGEHVYEHFDDAELIEVPQEEFITLAEAREKLVPLIEPLDAFDPLATA